MFSFSWLSLIFILLTTPLVYSLEDTSVLPTGVRAVIYKNGSVKDLGYKYSSGYELSGITERFSRKIDAKTLSTVNPEFESMIQLLDKEFPAYDIGSKLYLGELKVEGNPHVFYQAPAIAIGVNDKLTVAIGIPIVKYSLDFNVSHNGVNNVEYLKRALPDSHYDQNGEWVEFSSKLSKAYDELKQSKNIKNALDKIIKDKQYKPLGSRQQSIVGDIQIQSRYLFYNSLDWEVLYKMNLNLPTGPEDDPDDLLDFPLFHRSSIESGVVGKYAFENWSFIQSASYVWQLADKTEKRVPVSATDILPDPERKELLKRDLGDIFRYEVSASYKWSSALSFSAGLQYEWKQEDYYAGSRDYNYSLLSVASGTEAQKIQLASTFNTINAYMEKRFPVPFIVSYLFSDIYSGKNVEKQYLHEFSLTVLF